MADDKDTATAPPAPKPVAPTPIRVVDSLLDAMVDGREYQSIVDAVPAPTLNVVGEVQRALREIEGVRDRPCLAYVGNVVSVAGPGSELGPLDDLPFAEMIASIPADQRKADVS